MTIALVSRECLISPRHDTMYFTHISPISPHVHAWGQGHCYHPHRTDGKTETQSKVTYLESGGMGGYTASSKTVYWRERRFLWGSEDIWEGQGTVLVVTPGEGWTVMLSSSGWRTGMLLNIPPRTGQCTQQRTLQPGRNVSGAEVGKYRYKEKRGGGEGAHIPTASPRPLQDPEQPGLLWSEDQGQGQVAMPGRRLALYPWQAYQSWRLLDHLSCLL